MQLSVNVVSPDLNYADGVRFDFGESNVVLDAYLESDMGIDPAVLIRINTAGSMPISDSK